MSMSKISAFFCSPFFAHVTRGEAQLAAETHFIVIDISALSNALGHMPIALSLSRSLVLTLTYAHAIVAFLRSFLMSRCTICHASFILTAPPPPASPRALKWNTTRFRVAAAAVVTLLLLPFLLLLLRCAVTVSFT